MKNDKTPFGMALRDLQNCGYMQNVRPTADEGVYVATETVGWRNVARELAAQLNGIVRPNVSGGAVWQVGKRISGVVLEPEQAQVVKEARIIVNTLGANPDRRILHSLGSCARACLKFVGMPQLYTPEVERFLLGHPYGYHECRPGLYSTAIDTHVEPPMKHLLDEPVEYRNPDYVPPVTLYDIDSFYYDLFTRLPSLRISVSPKNKIRFHPMLPDDRCRWLDVLQAVKEHKWLRNTIAGSSAGSLLPGFAYTSVRPKADRFPKLYAEWTPGTVRVINPPGQPGPFRAAGLLVVATGAELCYMEAEFTDAVYSTADSVAVTGDTRPAVWKKYGFNVSIKAQGEGDICHRGSWKIGPRSTKPYQNKERARVPSERAPVPFDYSPQWINAR